MSEVQDKLLIEKARLEIEDQNAMRDAQRKMAWISLFGMLLYPILIILANYLGFVIASEILGNIAPTYFVSVAAIVAAFYGKQAYTERLN